MSGERLKLRGYVGTSLCDVEQENNEDLGGLYTAEPRGIDETALLTDTEQGEA